jgi:hypothetical protein
MKDYLYKLTDILETAARCDRYLPGLKKPTTPRMFDIIETTYNPSEHGYYIKPQLKLRATPKMIACWDVSIDLLLLLENVETRRLIWSKANKYSYSAIGRMLGLDRRKVKQVYITALIHLESLVKTQKDLLAKIDKIY